MWGRRGKLKKITAAGRPHLNGAWLSNKKRFIWARGKSKAKVLSGESERQMLGKSKRKSSPTTYRRGRGGLRSLVGVRKEKEITRRNATFLSSRITPSNEGERGNKPRGCCE